MTVWMEVMRLTVVCLIFILPQLRYESQRQKTYLLACAPQKQDNSACESVQSDQSFRCPYEQTLHTWLSECTK